MQSRRLTECSGLRLSSHLRACRVDDVVVLLDLNRSRYLGLKGLHARIVAGAIGEDTIRTDATASPATQLRDAIDLAAPLIKANILTTAPSPVRRAACHALPAASSAVVPDDSPGVAIRPRDLVRFIASIATAALWLRLRSLRAISESVNERLNRCELQAGDPASRLMRAVTVFDRLRPLAFTSKDRCLFDSLALILFLARQGLAASWVVGVATRPFRAHSWIQREGDVLNDLPDRVRQFTPILVV